MQRAQYRVGALAHAAKAPRQRRRKQSGKRSIERPRDRSEHQDEPRSDQRHGDDAIRDACISHHICDEANRKQRDHRVHAPVENDARPSREEGRQRAATPISNECRRERNDLDDEKQPIGGGAHLRDHPEFIEENRKGYRPGRGWNRADHREQGHAPISGVREPANADAADQGDGHAEGVSRQEKCERMPGAVEQESTVI